MKLKDPKRVVVWFSCGVTSAVAAKLTAVEYAGKLPVHLVYTDPGGEHPDNHRFLRDVEKWVGIRVEILRSDKYRDHWDVFEKTRWLVGPGGVRCTGELKKKLRQQYEDLTTDIQVFGYDAGEERAKQRATKFREANPEVDLRTPLIERDLTKADCMAIVERAGIQLPAMYGLGFSNANCLGCPQGQQGYWNRIRRTFPEVFGRMSKLERELDVAINKTYAGDGERKRVFLDELDPSAGRDDELTPECSLLCAIAEEEIRT